MNKTACDKKYFLEVFNMILKNKMELTISKAIKSDAVKMIEYLNIVGGESDNLLFGKNGFHMSVEDEEKYIENIKDSKTSALLVGKINGEVASIGSIGAPNRERIAHQSDIALSVKKSFWNIGVGTEMMNVLIEFAKQSGRIEIVHLGVRSDNINAIKLYEKMGFEKIGLYKKFFKIDGNYFDEVLMNLYL
jgi:RimJ/RimL family protein N-acetyltransferase